MSCPLDAYVIQSYRSTETNLHSALHRIEDAAGVERWPKPFIALRASRRTELERTGRCANHVLNDWFGHSGAIAETHYLQTTEDDYAEAASAVGPPASPSAGPSQGQQESPRDITKRKNAGETGVLMAADAYRSATEYTRRDSIPETYTGKKPESKAAVVTRVVTDPHQTHPETAELIAIFQTLNPTTQANLLAIARSLAAAKQIAQPRSGDRE